MAELDLGFEEFDQVEFPGSLSVLDLLGGQGISVRIEMTGIRVLPG
jgi:hypothetical protein